MENKYDYLEAMTDDIVNYVVSEQPTDEELRDDDFWYRIEEDCWQDSTITGNGEGGWYFDDDEEARKAVFTEENVKILVDALQEFGNAPESYRRAFLEPGYADCTICCYMLNQALWAAKERLLSTISEEEGA